MTPHKLRLRPALTLRVATSRLTRFTFAFVLLAILGSLSAEISFSKTPSGGRVAVVVDERLAALRATPELNGRLVRRLGRGRMVAIRRSQTTREGVVFLLVNVTTRTHGWIQREAVVSATRVGDDRRLLDLIDASEGFERIVRARIFLDYFTRSALRPQVLLSLSEAAEDQAARLSRDAARRLKGLPRDSEFAHSELAYFMNYAGLDRYNRQRVLFVFDPTTKRFHYDGAALRELIRRYPNSREAIAGRKRLAQRIEVKN